MRKLIEKLRLIISKFFSGEVHYVNGSETLPAPLSKDEERKLLVRYSQGDETVKDILITHNLRLVVYIARKFEAASANIEDLVSIGTIGLIKAVNTFCPDRNIKLATYASRCIENEILMYIRKTNNLKSEVSIDEPLNVDWDGNELLLSDVLGSDSDAINRPVELEDEIRLLHLMIEKLGTREKKIMNMRFGLSGYHEHTQKQVADILGISQSYISRLEKRIIERLRFELTKV